MCPKPLMKRRTTWGGECALAPQIWSFHKTCLVIVNQPQRHSEDLSVFKSGTGTTYYNGLKKHSILHFMTIFWSKPLWSVQYVFLSLLLQRMNVCTQQCDQNEVISMLPMAPQRLKVMQMIVVMFFFFCLFFLYWNKKGGRDLPHVSHQSRRMSDVPNVKAVYWCGEVDVTEKLLKQFEMEEWLYELT